MTTISSYFAAVMAGWLLSFALLTVMYFRLVQLWRRRLGARMECEPMFEAADAHVPARDSSWAVGTSLQVAGNPRTQRPDNRMRTRLSVSRRGVGTPAACACRSGSRKRLSNSKGWPRSKSISVDAR